MTDVARRVWWLALVVLVCGGFRTSAQAEEFGSSLGRFVNKLTYPEAFGVTLLHLCSRDPVRAETGKRMADAILIAGVLTAGLKQATHSPRPAPFQSEEHAFPSGHASLAFAVAASLSEREPRARWVAYPLAAASAWARYDVQRHSWAQVIGGAVLGTFVGIRAGRGEWTLFGHSDADLALTLGTAGLGSEEGLAGPLASAAVALWGTSF